MSDTAVAESGTRLQNFLDRAGFRGFPWKTATILYTISWGWLFIVRNSYWSDDWDGFKFRGITDFDYGALGIAPWTQINLIVFDAFGPGIFRVLIFVLFFGSAVLLYGIGEKSDLLNSCQRKAVALLFLILPFNSARLALSTFHYSAAYSLFFLAWFVFVRFSTFRSKFLSLMLFVLSFQMFSNLIFFLLPVMHFYLLEGRGDLRAFLNWLRKCLAFVLAPITFWVLRNAFWPGSGDYHDVTSNKVFGFLQIALLFCLVIVFLLLGSIWTKSLTKRKIIIVKVGLVTIFVGYAPYVFYGLVGYGFNVPITYLVTMLGRSDWYSRHQILQPLGFSILLVGLIGLLPSFTDRFRHWFVGAILAISVVFNVGFGFEYVVDYSKQTSVVNALSAESNKTAGEEIQMVDQTTFLNARQRSYRERDWLGLIGLAEGVDSAKKLKVIGSCSVNPNTRLVLIKGPETHWEALKNWVSDGDMGFEVTVDDTPGACKPEMVTSEKVSGAIPILFYFTGANG